MTRNLQIALASTIAALIGAATHATFATDPTITQARALQRANPDFHIWIELHEGGEAEIIGAPKS